MISSITILKHLLNLSKYKIQQLKTNFLINQLYKFVLPPQIAINNLNQKNICIKNKHIYLSNLFKILILPNVQIFRQ